MNIKEIEEKLLSNKKFRREYDRKDLAFEIGEMIIDARVKAGLTQEKLAKKVKTKQPSIARLENGSYLPSISFLDRIAKALGTDLIPPKFSFLENNESVNASASAHQTIPSNDFVPSYSLAGWTLGALHGENAARDEVKISGNTEVEKYDFALPAII